jgi:2-phospho-L-lactate guanylyltransferase
VSEPRVVVVLPLKSFTRSKARLVPALTAERRVVLAKALAGRTAMVARDSGADVLVVTDDAEVERWATPLGLPSIRQRRPGLDGAASDGVAAVRAGAPWVVLHADLPWITAPVLRQVVALARQRPVIAPSYDGGTNALGGPSAGFPFAYGPQSFHRHFAAAPDATVMIDPALALDLDRPRDLQMAIASPPGRWLRRSIGALPRAPLRSNPPKPPLTEGNEREDLGRLF